MRDKSIHHIKAILPYQGYIAISRLHCHITATLPYQGYFAIARLFCHIKVTLPYHGYIAISKLLCHQCEASLPPIQAQRLQDHPWPSLIISFDLLLLELQTNECNGQSKTHQKTFPVKENCHTIKSAGVHAFHPHLSFCLKLAHFIPAFHILFFFYPC